jgi:hypothetical protein
MKKFIMLMFLVLSLATMVLFTIALDELFTMLGLGIFQIEELMATFEEMTLSEIAPVLGIALWGLFQLYGVPLIVFLVSLIGLTKNK